LYSQGKIEEAIAEWEDVVRKNPGNTLAEMYLRLVKKESAG
jgi:TolA-binding protein